MKTLMFNKWCFAYNNKLLPFFGDINIVNPNDIDTNSFLEFYSEGKYDQVIFTNPFLDKKIKIIYKTIKNSNINFYVIERGALPDSMYIDSTGFCCDSTMYKEEFWNKTLTFDIYKRLNEYINNYKNNNNYLEKNPPKIGREKLRSKIGFPRNTKFIFVPLQSRSDVTVTHFPGKIGNYDNFILLINEISSKISNNYKILVKKHPLSICEEKLNNVLFLNEENIDDLIDISDYVLLMNSGVGILSYLKYKPVISTSIAFYNQQKLCFSTNNSDDILYIIKNEKVKKRMFIQRFLSYLINNFYSFASMKNKTEKYTNEANKSVTYELSYYKILFN